ncbi:CDGSH iron-sulfur domain-containing protein [Leptospirillum ferrooxidans]|uniref:CDGSH iron-sulfur domain-containing protein n=1 Tax=Leptospirillum ferrooxidans TaxID=180 RepID=UPI002A4E2D71|nr:CDGSH iron-sulfur domain-containing protein [Leptospirillum ferrooxidans]
MKMDSWLSCSKNGPILVHGEVDIEDANGHHTKTATMVHQLCRCGGSRVAPFCDGSHENISFVSE